MFDGLDEEPVVATPKQQTPTKQRKVRKGTRSCWECKRRKIRCIFPRSDDVACVSCQRRRTPCVGQDMPEALSPAQQGNRHLGERIAKVEDVMKTLLASKDTVMIDHREEEQPQNGCCPNDEALSNGAYASASIRALTTPVESAKECARPSQSFQSKSPDVSGKVEAGAPASHTLWAAFPTKHDAKILLKESARTSRYTNATNIQRHSKLTYETLAAPYPPSKLPGHDTHPIVLARCLLMFAITLQSPCEATFHDLSEQASVLGRRFVTAAMTWVTANEEVQGSIDNLICIMLEGVYAVNCGNLRRAWFIYRKAIAMAQMMGLHRSTTLQLKRIDPALDADPDFMWFRIVYMDRYLSLLLGLPQGTSDMSIESPLNLQDEPPLGRFERFLTIIAASVLERNEKVFPTGENKTTKFIDSQLLSLSESMPADFWRPANFQDLIPGSAETLLETVRLAAQVYYFGLLVQLHLPWMMCGGDGDTEHEYSRITCVNASREIMTRFIAHRSFNPRTSCSRPVDFFALLASMTLLLAHLDAHNRRGQNNLLAHQRLSDRALLNQALKTMAIVSDIDKDNTMDKSAQLIEQLLKIEADAAEGNSYVASSVRGSEDSMKEASAREDGDLRLHIPYLGVIKIARQHSISRVPSQRYAACCPTRRCEAEFSQKEPSPATSSDAFTSPNELTYSSNSLPRNQYNLSQNHTFSSDLTASKWWSIQLQTPQYDQHFLQQHQPSSQEDITPDAHMDLPAITASVDDWAFQGVDTAFFDSLIRGASYAEDDTLKQWEGASKE